MRALVFCEPQEAAIGSIDLFKELHRWIRQLGRELSPIDVICAVAERMCKAKGEERDILARQLGMLLLIDGHYQEARQVWEMLIEELPDDVEAPIRMAALYLYHLDDPEEALRHIDVALERAWRTRFFLRRALAYKARILVELERGQQLSDVLEEIMALKISKPIPDVGRERDFVDRAPPGLIRGDVLARYNLFRPKRPDDTTIYERPRFEFPDDWEWLLNN